MTGVVFLEVILLALPLFHGGYLELEIYSALNIPTKLKRG